MERIDVFTTLEENEKERNWADVLKLEEADEDPVKLRFEEARSTASNRSVECQMSFLKRTARRQKISGIFCYLCLSR